MSFDERYQSEKNGPLKKELADRIRRLRKIFTLAEIGKHLTFSGAWVSQILNESTPSRVDSKHIPRILDALVALETKYAKKLGLSGSLELLAAPSPTTPPSDFQRTLDYHLSAIDALGWKVSGLERKV